MRARMRFTGALSALCAICLSIPVLADARSANATTASPISTVASMAGVTVVARAGNSVYSTGDSYHTISKIDLAAGNAVTTFVGDGTECSDQTAACGDGGSATSAQLGSPNTLYSSATHLYINDLFSGRIRRVDFATNTITTVAGTGVPGFGGDGGAATSAQIGGIISGMVVDASGNLYFSDTLNERIRCVGCTGAGVISTVAGTGNAVGSGGVTSASADGTAATSANLIGPMGIAIQPGTGHLVFAQGCSVMAAIGAGQSYCDSTVRKIDGSGNLVTLAGTSGVVGSSGMGGAATAATLRTPSAISYRADGTLLISEMGTTFLNFVAALSGGSLVGIFPAVRCVSCLGDGKISLVAGANSIATTAQWAARKAVLIGTANFASETSPNSDLYFGDQMFGELRKVTVTKATPAPPNVWSVFTATSYAGVRNTNVNVTVRVENRGEGAAPSDLTLVIALNARTLPGSRTLNGLQLASFTPSGFSCTQSGTTTITLTCTRATTLAARTRGGSAPSVALVVNQSVAANYTITATATHGATDRLVSNGVARRNVRITQS